MISFKTMITMLRVLLQIAVTLLVASKKNVAYQDVT
jgi:hypothetical protein